MRIGLSIVLIAIGAILALAVDDEVSGVDLSMVGWILALVGVLGLVVTLVIWAPRRRRPAETVVEERPVVEERRRYGQEPPV